MQGLALPFEEMLGWASSERNAVACLLGLKEMLIFVEPLRDVGVCFLNSQAMLGFVCLTPKRRWDLFDSKNVSRQKSYVSRIWFRENTYKFLDPRKGEVVSKMNDVMLKKEEAFVYNYSHSIFV